MKLSDIDQSNFRCWICNNLLQYRTYSPYDEFKCDNCVRLPDSNPEFQCLFYANSLSDMILHYMFKHHYYTITIIYNFPDSLEYEYILRRASYSSFEEYEEISSFSSKELIYFVNETEESILNKFKTYSIFQ